MGGGQGLQQGTHAPNLCFMRGTPWQLQWEVLKAQGHEGLGGCSCPGPGLSQLKALELEGSVSGSWKFSGCAKWRVGAFRAQRWPEGGTAEVQAHGLMVSSQAGMWNLGGGARSQPC